MRYDLLVIGMATEGIEVAVQCASHGARVAVVENVAPDESGRNCRFRESDEAIFLRVAKGLKRRKAAGCASFVDLAGIHREIDEWVRAARRAVYDRLQVAGVDVVAGTPSFVTSEQIIIHRQSSEILIDADSFVIATGCQTNELSRIPFDGRRVVSVADWSLLDRVPESIVISGFSDGALAIAGIFAAAGGNVVVIHGGQLTDPHVNESAVDCALALGVGIRTNEDVIGIVPGEPVAGSEIDHDFEVVLSGGRRLISTAFVQAKACRGATDELNLVQIGVEVDESGRLWCNERLQTWQPHIYGAGTVVGFSGTDATVPNVSDLVAARSSRSLCESLRFSTPAASEDDVTGRREVHSETASIPA